MDDYDREARKAIGSLVDHWEGMPNDDRQVLSNQYPDLTARLDELMRVLTSDEEEDE